MEQTYTAFMKSRAKKQKAGTKAGDKVTVTAAKKPKKKFEEYMENWSLPPKKKRKGSATNLSDPTGGAKGVIASTGTIQSKMGKKEEQTTRIRRTKEPRKGVITFINAAKRRKRVVVEI